MTQIIVTLDNGADISFIQRVIENMKGVVKTSLQNSISRKKDDAANEWIKKMTALSDSIDPSIIDWNDDKTRYLMSK